MANPPIIDIYAPLNRKAAMSSDPGPKVRPKSWVGKDHARRLTAYQILDAYSKNNAYHYRADDKERQTLREYGDGDALVEAIHSALIGDSQALSVDHAAEFDPAFEETQDTTAGQIERQRLAEQAAERQEMLEQWAEDERMIIKVIGAERKANRLGDTVYALTWSSKRSRPRLRTYDPAAYFPVLDDVDEEFPSKVHLAWEIEDPDDANKLKVRRITYELKDIEPEEGTETGWPEGVTFNEVEGKAGVQLPWNPPDQPATQLCYISDGTWDIDVSNRGLDDFDESKATWALSEDGEVLRDLRTSYDFIPVVHVPNTEEDEEHFGVASIMRVVQLLDDLANCDTNTVDAAANSGFPAIGFEGGAGPELDEEGEIKGGWGPGSFLHNPNGKISMLSTADALQPLSELKDDLLDRLSVNARTPATALGRIKPNAQESGIHLSLSWGPLRSLVSQMRLGRKGKYSLLLKMVQRMFMLDGQIEPGPDNILDAEVVFGSFLPTDTDAEIDRIIKLFTAKPPLLSRRTAISMLMELGVSIDDADEELQRIEREDFEGAAMLLEATGNEQAAAKRLGVDAGVPSAL